MKEEKVRKMVREGYAKIAKAESCCCPSEVTQKMGYTKKELKSVPEGATLSLGCGNPVALASLKDGETVVDLGSGGGLDCFLAANKVGEQGHVIGVDMTAEMIDKARDNLRRSKHKNVEFRLGEIENLPVADNTADVIISNCVINLSPAKGRVFKEAFRILKPGGRLMISDIVLLKQLPKSIEKNVKAYINCVSGAVKKDEYVKLIEEAGFQEVRIVGETRFPLDSVLEDSDTKALIEESNMPVDDVKELANSIASVKVEGIKPR